MRKPKAFTKDQERLYEELMVRAEADEGAYKTRSSYRAVQNAFKIHVSALTRKLEADFGKVAGRMTREIDERWKAKGPKPKVIDRVQVTSVSIVRFPVNPDCTFEFSEAFDAEPMKPEEV